MGFKLVLAALGVLLAGTPALAHHAFSAQFDANQPLTLHGTVTKIEMLNPHGWIHIDVKDKDGKVISWAIETGSPNALARRGIKKNFLPIGSDVIVTGFRAKDMSFTASGDNVKFPDGRSFGLASSAGESGPGAKPDAK